MKRAPLRIALLLGLVLAAPLAWAATPTYYVTDRLVAELHARPDLRSPVVASLPTGTPLQVVNQTGDFTQAVAPGDQRGWILSRLISTEEPAMATLLRLRDEQARTRVELERVRAQRAEASLWSLVVTAIGALMIGFALGVLWLDHRVRVRHGGFRI